MTTGRRRVLLSAMFFSLALLFTGTTARAQDRSHRLWQQNLTPEQVRAALARLGNGDLGGTSPFEEMVKDYLLKNNPGIDKDKAAEVIKRLTSDKQLMDQLKQFAKQRQTDPGRPGKLTEDDLAKMFNPRPGELPKLPKDIVPPDINGFNDPRFRPKDPPPLDPKTPPDVHPNPKVQDPNSNLPPPKLPDPADPGPKVNREPRVPPEPKVVPNAQPEPGATRTPGKDTISLDENPFPEPEEANDPRTKSLEAFAALWERNVGPLSETPEVQRALFEAMGSNGFDFDFKDENGNSFWDLLRTGDPNLNFGDLFGNSGNTGSSNWNFGDWKLPRFSEWFGSGRSFSGSSSSRPSWSSSSSPRSSSSSSSSGWNWGGGPGSLRAVWLPLVVLLLVILGLFIWFKLKQLNARAASSLPGYDVGPWPLDPRSISTRQDVVKAFEYLSVLICGPAAKNWTHNTIADALTDLARTQPDSATMLARLYELARYAPLNETLSRAELAEARDLVCHLAGVSA